MAATAEEILGNYPRGRILIGVDGLPGSGRAAFADDLAAEFARRGHDVARVSLDGFADAEAVDAYRDGAIEEGFRHTVLEPFRRGAAFATEASGAELHTGAEDVFLFADGGFLNRSSLRGVWHYTIWLDVDEAVRAERNPGADTASAAAYLRDANPRGAAIAIIDNTDAAHPRRQFADAC